MQMRLFLLLDGKDQAVQLAISRREKPELIFEVPVHRAFDGFRANPHHALAHQRGQSPKDKSTEAPKCHNPAGTRLTRRHCRPEQPAVLDFIAAHLLKGRHDGRKQPSGQRNLCAIDANGAELAGMIDREDPPNSQRLGTLFEESQIQPRSPGDPIGPTPQR